jgi:hypothetical protein
MTEQMKEGSVPDNETITLLGAWQDQKDMLLYSSICTGNPRQYTVLSSQYKERYVERSSRHVAAPSPLWVSGQDLHHYVRLWYSDGQTKFRFKVQACGYV